MKRKILIKVKYSVGFTLIELLVVIAVVGVLAGAVIAMINPGAQLGRARDAARKSDLKQIRNALERYKVATGTYPVYSPWIYSTSANWIPLLVTSGELKAVPVDPESRGGGCGSPWGNSAQCYWYAYVSKGVTYDLVAHLENTSDDDRCEIKQWRYMWGGNLPWCSGTYTYSIQIYAPGPDQ